MQLPLALLLSMTTAMASSGGWTYRSTSPNCAGTVGDPCGPVIPRLPLDLQNLPISMPVGLLEKC